MLCNVLIQNSDIDPEKMSSVITSVSPTTESHKHCGDYETRNRKQYDVEANTRSSNKIKELKPARDYTLRANPAKVVALQIDGSTKQTYSKLISFVQ